MKAIRFQNNLRRNPIQAKQGLGWEGVFRYLMYLALIYPS